MGQTVRNQGPYDRLWMPGAPHNRSEKPERAKIEYLADVRRARAAQQAEQQDALQYDSRLRKAAAIHGERAPRQHFLKDATQPVRPRPQGVGGRQQMPRSQQAPIQIRGRQNVERQQPARGVREARPGSGQPAGRQQPGSRNKARQGSAARQNQAQQGKGQGGTSRQNQARQGKGQGGTSRQNQARQGKGQGGTSRQNQAQQGKSQGGTSRQNQVRQGKDQAQAIRQSPPGAARQAQPKKARSGSVRQSQPQRGREENARMESIRTAEKRPARNGQPSGRTASAARPRPAGRNQSAARGSNRPQRDTVTDFHSIEPKPQSAGQPRRESKPPAAKKKKSNGHGRKLTPTYDLKGSRKHQGAHIMEGGVVGFDMGTYGRDAAAPSGRPMKIGSVISTILTVAIIFVLLTAVLAGQARLAGYTQQNATLEKSISEMEESISKLKMQIALEEDLGNIQERAAALGLRSPDDSQVQYVDLDETDDVNAAPSLVLQDQEQAAVPGSLLESLAAWFDTMLHGSTEQSAASAAPTAG